MVCNVDLKKVWIDLNLDIAKPVESLHKEDYFIVLQSITKIDTGRCQDTKK